MAGIYIHIPFCKQACSYCNFHFSTKLLRKPEMVACIIDELEKRKDYLNQEKIETIYFGGGTPSLLSEDELSLIFDRIHQHFEIDEKAEITLEANPDDLNKAKLKALSRTPINRLSIGVQSFFNEDLRLMNRAHQAHEALDSIKMAQDMGFNQLNIDLIFGSQTTTDAMWSANLEQFFKLNIPHLSAYSLTLEEKTALAHRIKHGQVSPIDEERNFRQYSMLQKAMNTNGFDQYELSNYCKDNQYAKHNTGYWFGNNYLGIGPSAHSFNGSSRQWNINNNLKYIQSIHNNSPFYEKEELSEKDQYHEYLITALRTKWGVKFETIQRFSAEINQHFFKKLDSIQVDGFLKEKNGVKIQSASLFQSDIVVRELMID